MAREHFNEQLARLDTELLKMGALVEQALKGALRTLETGDVSLAVQVVESDDEINQKERDIEVLCLDLLLRQQPVARDLRTISAALKMITDIERIGDQAADICQILLDRRRVPVVSSSSVSGYQPDLLSTSSADDSDIPASTFDDSLGDSLARVGHLVSLGEAARAQVSAAIDAFVAHDVERAQAVIADDDRIDRLFRIVKDELFIWMRDSHEVQDITIDLLLIAKYFERVGDHAQNIAEWVEYSITGMHKGALIA
jgi:phosphate transport system protein